MVVGEVANHTEVLVIGGGPGGYTAALRAAEAGKSVVLVEAKAMGGTCLNVGCIPSKALIEVANVAALSERTADWGVRVHTEVDMAMVGRHLGSVVSSLTDGLVGSIGRAGVEVIDGTARFSRPDRVAVERGDQVEHWVFDHCIVATGSRPIQLANLPVDGDRVLDSTGALALTELPATLAVVGGGYIGVELGTAFAKLGCSVTIVELAPRILPSMGRHLGRSVERRLPELGIDLRLATAARGVTAAGLLVEPPDVPAGSVEEILAEKIIVAVGRRPNSDTCGLEQIGVTVDERGFVVVDPARRATPTIFAIGDLTAGPALAHKATAEAEVAVEALLGEPVTFDPAAIPAVVFSDPEVVSVGEQPDTVGTTTKRVPLRANARAQTMDDTAGLAQLVVAESGIIVGVHLEGPHVSELAGEAALAIEMAATVEDLALTIHPHPTLSEILPDAARR